MDWKIILGLVGLGVAGYVAYRTLHRGSPTWSYEYMGVKRVFTLRPIRENVR